MNNKIKAMIYTMMIIIITIPVTIGIIPSSVYLFGWFSTLFCYILVYIISFCFGSGIFYALLECLQEERKNSKRQQKGSELEYQQK